MAEETVDEALKVFNLTAPEKCQTDHIKLIGGHAWSKTMFIKLIQQVRIADAAAVSLVNNISCIPFSSAWKLMLPSTCPSRTVTVHGPSPRWQLKPVSNSWTVSVNLCSPPRVILQVSAGPSTASVCPPFTLTSRRSADMRAESSTLRLLSTSSLVELDSLS